MKKESKKAGEYFSSGYCWSESILLSVSESKGIKSDLIPKIATGLCGGVSNTDGICGAITGGVLAINMIEGRSEANASRDDLKSKVQTLVSRLDEEFGSKKCYELCGCDLGTDEGQEKYNIEERYELCDKFVANATEITIDLINEKS